MNETVERRGEVVGFEDDLALVRLEPAAECGSCSCRSTCASGNAAVQVIRMPLNATMKQGDQVSVSMPSTSLTQAAVIGYVLPPLALLLGALVAATCFEGDAAAVLGAGLGFAGGLLLVRLISNLAFGRGLAAFACESKPHEEYDGRAPQPDLQTGEQP